MNNKLADMALALVAVIWGTGFAAAQMALDAKLSPFQIMTYRFFISSVLMIVIFWKEFKKIRLPEIKAGAVIGVFLFLAFAFQTIGLQYTTPSKNAFITATNVVMVPFLYWILLKKKPDKYSIAGALLTIVGISFLTLEGSFNVSYGDFLTLICALGFAMHIISIGHYTRKHSPIKLVIIQMIVAFILSLLSLLYTQDAVTLSAKGSFAVIYLGVLSTTVAFLIQNIAQKYVNATKTAIILSTEAVFGTLSSIVFLGESLNLKMIAGCVIIFTAIIVAETKLSFIKGKSQSIA
jgi:drug/metabolite transporter (DMT)-like permease